MLIAIVLIVLFASGIDNRTNWSAGYASLTYQSLFVNYSHESATKTYSAKNPTFFLPSALVVYKRNMLGFYGAFNSRRGAGASNATTESWTSTRRCS